MGEIKNLLTTIAGLKNKLKLNKRRTAFGIGSLLLLGIIVVALVLINLLSNRSKPMITDTVCTTAQGGKLFSDATNNLLASPAQLYTVVGTIQKLKNYNHDPNCMFILTYYYTKIYDYPMAQASLNTLTSLYKNNNLSPKLTAYLSLTQLKERVASTKSVYEQTKSDSMVL